MKRATPDESTPEHRREISVADLVLLVVGTLVIVPLVYGVGDLLVGTLSALPVVGSLVTPGITAAGLLLLAIHVLPMGGRTGYRLGAVLVGVGFAVSLVPVLDGCLSSVRRRFPSGSRSPARSYCCVRPITWAAPGRRPWS